MPKYLTVQETAEELGIHPKTLYLWINRNQFPCTRINGVIRILIKDLNKWIEGNSEFPTVPQPILSKLDVPLAAYDRMLLKGDSAVSKRKQRWNYGFGSVYTRRTVNGKERWYIDYKVSGRRVREVVCEAQTRGEAIVALQEKVAAAFDDVYHTKRRERRITFAEFSEIYINDYAKANKKSWKSDEYRIEANMKPFFGSYLMEDVSPLLIEKYRAERLKIGVSKSTVNRELTIMKKMYNLAIDWNLANENPVAKVKLFSEKGTEKARILAHAEEAALIAESPDYLRPILIVAVNTGMRRGEILNLKWSQVDLGSGLIRVEQTKSGHMRFIPINDQARGALREAQGQNTASVYVFPNPRTGMPFTEARKSFKAACQRAGISDLRFHDLRHYAEFRTMPSWITRIIKLLESKRIVVLMGELYSA